MMKTLKLTLFLLFMPTFIWAQARPTNRMERLNAAVVAFISEKVGFTPEEAQKFWPVHNEMRNKLEAIRLERHNIMHKHRGENNFENTSNESMRAELFQLLDLEQRELDLKVEYNTKFLNILPPKKVALLYFAEEQFKRDLIRRFSERRMEHMTPNESSTGNSPCCD